MRNRMPERPFNVLFLCTGNSARSIMAEAILNKQSDGKFKAFSAGSRPRGEVHPFALNEPTRLGFPISGLVSKSWTAFATPDAPHMDFIFTVCDGAAGETCPVWPAHPATAHWGIEDPAAVEGTKIAREQAFVLAARYLRNRIAAFVNLQIRSLDELALEARLKEIGRMEGKSGRGV